MQTEILAYTGSQPGPEKIMKTIKLNIKNASAGQMLTLRGELRVMAQSWKKVGPVIEVQAGRVGPQANKLESEQA